jgi:hypothetical protein
MRRGSTAAKPPGSAARTESRVDIHAWRRERWGTSGIPRRVARLLIRQAKALMSTLYVIAAIAGGAVLALQLIGGLVGLIDLDLDHDAPDGVIGGLDLRSIRALSAGATFFGLVGLGIGKTALGPWVALPFAVAAGVAAAAGVAVLMRTLGRLEKDAVVNIENAVGLDATVYLSIPAGRERPGKIHVNVQDRLVEFLAVSEESLATGRSVLVIDVVNPETVEVVPSPQLAVFHGDLAH